MSEVNKDDLIARYREALDLIWHVAPLPTQTERERLERIHGIVKIVLSHTYDPWQPIDTAPKEQPVIVWCDGAIGEAYYDDDHGDWWWANTSRDDYLSSKIFPTLWRPMPAPPRFDGRAEAGPVTMDDLEEQAKRLCEAEGYSWDRISETYESPLNEYRSKAFFRRLATKIKNT